MADQAIDPIRAERLSYEAIDSAAHAIAHHLEAAEAMRAGALHDLGDLMQQVAAHNATYPDDRQRVVSQIAFVTTLSRPMLYKARDEHDPEQSSPTLANYAIDYGLGTGDRSEEELHRRYPWLQGWSACVTWMRYTGARERWDAEHPEDDDTESRDIPPLTAVDASSEYRRIIEQIAARRGALG